MKEKEEDGAPLGLGAYLLTGLVLLGMILGFALLCREQYLHIPKVDVGSFDEPCPENLLFEVQGRHAGSGLYLDGYVLLDGERLEWVKCFAALYHADSGEYFRLHTVMSDNLEAAALQSAPDSRAGLAGFGAYLHEKCLSEPAESYEICFLYETNHHHILVHTGRTLQEVTA